MEVKKLSAVLALLICALFFVFAACEEKEEETDIPEQPEQPSVSYEVTDEEWRAALDESVLDDISYTYTMTQGARSACARISVLRKDGSILRHEQQTMTEGSSSQTQEFYFEYTQNGNYQYTLQDDGLWLKTQTSVFPGEQTYFFVQLKDAFSDFAFNGENHTYHASDVTVTIADAYTYRCAAQVKFENKKLLSARLDMQTETEETLVHLYEFNGTADVRCRAKIRSFHLQICAHRRCMDKKRAHGQLCIRFLLFHVSEKYVRDLQRLLRRTVGNLHSKKHTGRYPR